MKKDHILCIFGAFLGITQQIEVCITVTPEMGMDIQCHTGI